MSKKNDEIKVTNEVVDETVEVVDGEVIEEEAIVEESKAKKFWNKIKKPALIATGVISGAVILGKIMAGTSKEVDLFEDDDEDSYEDLDSNVVTED